MRGLLLAYGFMNIRERSRASANAMRNFVLHRVRSGEYRAGEQLPTERELVERFGGSRGAVRRMLKQLENEGLVRREVGRGTFLEAGAAERIRSNWSGIGSGMVAVATLAPAGAPQSIGRLASPLDVMELRILLEPGVVEQAVRHASQIEIEGMRQLLVEASESRTLEAFEHWDDMLHKAFAAASRNPLVISVYEMISAVRLEAQWGEMKRRTLTEALKKRHFDEHVRIVNAFSERDPARARSEMQLHLEHIRRNMFGAT